MALPARRADTSPGARLGGALRAARQLVLPGAAAAGLLWILVPGQYLAAKALLASWGIPPIAGALLAPLGLGALVLGARWAWRTFDLADALRTILGRPRRHPD